jgi:hypothetical protein
MSERRFPNLFEVFWNLPVHLLGTSTHWLMRTLVWVYRACVIAVVVYLALARMYYKWTMEST